MKIPQTKQIWHPYWEWECFKNGFYASIPASQKEELRKECSYFLGDLTKFKEGINLVIFEWVKSCENFLTNPNINRIAWMGQASCCRVLGLSSYNRGGFYLLSERKQKEANQLALNEIIKYIKEKNNENKSTYKQLYFKMD